MGWGHNDQFQRAPTCPPERGGASPVRRVGTCLRSDEAWLPHSLEFVQAQVVGPAQPLARPSWTGPTEVRRRCRALAFSLASLDGDGWSSPTRMIHWSSMRRWTLATCGGATCPRIGRSNAQSCPRCTLPWKHSCEWVGAARVDWPNPMMSRRRSTESSSWRASTWRCPCQSRASTTGQRRDGGDRAA